MTQYEQLTRLLADIASHSVASLIGMPRLFGSDGRLGQLGDLLARTQNPVAHGGEGDGTITPALHYKAGRILRAFEELEWVWRTDAWMLYQRHLRELADERVRADLPERLRQADAVLHPTGRCTCHGEGTCTWCLDIDSRTE